MTPSFKIEEPDSLQVLLDNAHAVKNINQERIAHVLSRKDQRVIIKHKYTLQTKRSSPKRQKTLHIVNHSDDLFDVTDKTYTKSVDDIIAKWKYSGMALIKERIAFGYFIDLRLERFDDLLRLQEEYVRLLSKYSHVLADEEESRLAVEGILKNMQILQVAIDEIHLQTLDVAGPVDITDAMTSLMKNISKEWKTFHSKLSRLEFNADFHAQIVQKTKTQVDMVEFNDCKALECRLTSADHKDWVWALETYTINKKRYLASASADNMIKIWDLSNNTVEATLKGHAADIIALTLYARNGVQMLASGSSDNTIKLWNLSNNENVHTLKGHSDSIYSLAVYEKKGETVVISGSRDNTIKFWDVENNTVISTLHGHTDDVRALKMYNRESEWYLASGSYDKTIKIWSLEDHKLVSTLNSDYDIVSLAVFDHNGERLLASGDIIGEIKLWSLECYDLIRIIQAHSGTIYTLDVLKSDGKLCLMSGGSNKMINIWDVTNNSTAIAFNTDSEISSTRVFMNGDRACFAMGYHSGQIKMWME